ncbi:hypothetical protein Q4Q39_05075 [Flavivirga amylovorans]|uniref:Uncharacterized protein n=1 Tax=Flavivirga amylovorans TaxID=870486 RepID=A0ABT8WYL0_9FLAO|nr:hypothetical protein [Flavivirga amylovorans]MDO5986775.1 hypothetical protein [Flavivirga amylovorans]
MTNFKQLTIGVLMLGTLGVTSCVDDEISSEVKAIYQGQAAFLSAQSNLKQAEADLKAADAAYQLLINIAKEAQNELEILEAQNALEIAREEHIKALLQLKLDVEATKSSEAEKYLGQYLSEKGNIMTLKSSISSLNADLLRLNATVADGIFDTEEAIELEEINIAQYENQLVEDEFILGLLKAVESDPASVGNQVIEIQKQIDALKAENKEKNARVTEISTTELPKFGGDLSDYQNIKTEVQGLKNSVQSWEVYLSEFNDQLAEVQEELGQLTGGTAITYEQALVNRDNAEATKDEKQDVFDTVSMLASEYSDLINDIAAVDAQIKQKETSISSIENSLEDLKSEFDTRKSIFDNDPSGKTVDDKGADGKAGNPNDNFPSTYHLVLDATADPISYEAQAYFTMADLPVGAVIGAVPTDGEYFDVEADDTAIVYNEDAFNAAQSAFINAQVALSNEKSALADYEAELVELKEKQATFDTTLSTQLENARREKEEADAAYDLASDIVSLLESIIPIENDILDTKTSLEVYKLRLADSERELNRLADLVDDATFAEYSALLAQVFQLEQEVAINEDMINDLEGDIIYFEGLELELEASNYAGSDYEERLERIAEEIKDQEVAILETKKNITSAKNKLEELKQDKVDLEETRLTDIAEIEARIELLESEISQREQLAENYLALMNDALS